MNTFKGNMVKETESIQEECEKKGEIQEYYLDRQRRQYSGKGSRKRLQLQCRGQGG